MTTSSREHRITGVLLAGGQGSRMGGVDKGLVTLKGRPMAEWVIERLRPQVDEVIINANQNIDRYAGFGHPVFPDEIEGFAGPLAGLHAALSRAAHPLVVTVPCDSPFLPADLVSRLYDGLINGEADLAVAKTFEQAHPVFCICRREVLPHLTHFLASGGRKIDRWYETLKVVSVQFDDQEAAFRNINTREELGEFDGGAGATAMTTESGKTS
jgi:molybdenum cofactor guanylyltransferase